MTRTARLDAMPESSTPHRGVDGLYRVGLYRLDSHVGVRRYAAARLARKDAESKSHGVVEGLVMLEGRLGNGGGAGELVGMPMQCVGAREHLFTQEGPFP